MRYDTPVCMSMTSFIVLAGQLSGRYRSRGIRRKMFPDSPADRITRHPEEDFDIKIAA